MLAVIWYLVIFLALICYAMLDGFDLGVGILHLFTKKDRDRRIFINSIGPVWDGNEVWLVIVGGALFAGFPIVFATVFSAFYIPTMVLLMGLIFRAVSIEVRSKRESPVWRANWDRIFSFGSFVIAFGVGVVLGNLMGGLALDQNHNFVGQFVDFLNPYSLLLGATVVALFAMHGAVFLVGKTEGALQKQVCGWVPRCIGIFFILYIVLTIYSIIDKPYVIGPMRTYPIIFLVPLAAFAAIILVPYFMKKGKQGIAFIFSCGAIALLLSLAAIGTFPYMVRSTINPKTNSLFIENSASSDLTLKILLIIAGIGVPLVLAYGFYIYRTFRGKVKIDVSSY